jgi:hypothetical protein
MNELLKYLGIILILAGVIALGVYATHDIISNTLLAISALLLVGGVAVHVIANKAVE